MVMDQVLGRRVVSLGQRIVANFDRGNWEEVGLLIGHSDIINSHERLLRSLDWGDTDYSGNVLNVLRRIADYDPSGFREFERYVDQKFPDRTEEYVSAKPADRRITFAPSVFAVPEASVELDLVAVMMPLRAEFDPVYKTIVRACKSAGFRSLRADDIWEDSVIIQDIFNLIFRAQVVVVDFSTKNPNVMYETGIAHTLGKHVFPISQSLDDVPFDLQHHRVLRYLNNRQGLEKMEATLGARLRQVAPPSSDDDDEVPF
jgi:hypothetical protein